MIVSYGALRHCREYVVAWSVDAVHQGAAAQRTSVQVGTPFELAALQLAGRVATAADAAGVAAIREIVPQGDDPLAIAACCHTAAELGARIVKPSFPQPAAAIAEAVGCGIAVELAGGDPRDPGRSLADAADVMRAGAAGVAFGHNAWGADDPAEMRELGRIVHGAAAPAS